MKLKQTTVFD